MGGFASDSIELEVGIHGHVLEGQAFATPFATRADFDEGGGGARGRESIKGILISPEELADHQAWLASRCQDEESETEDDSPNSSPPLVNNDSVVDNDEELTSMKSSNIIQNSKKKKVSVSTIHSKLYEMAPKYWNVDDKTVHTRFTIYSGAGDDQHLTVVKESEPIRGPKYYIMVDAQRGATKIVHSAYPAMDGWEGTELEERGFEMIIGSTTTAGAKDEDLTTLLSDKVHKDDDDDSQATIRIKTTRYASGSKSNLLNDVLVDENRDDDENEELLEEEEEEVRGGVEMILNKGVGVKSKRDFSSSNNNKSKKVDHLHDFSTADFICADVTGCYPLDLEEDGLEEEEEDDDEDVQSHDEVTLDHDMAEIQSVPLPAVEELEGEIAKLKEERKNLLRSARRKRSYFTKIKNYAADAADVIKSIVPTSKHDMKMAAFEEDTVLHPAMDDQTCITDDGSRTWHTNDDRTRSIKSTYLNAIDTIAATVGRWTTAVCGMADVITMTSCSATAGLFQIAPHIPQCAGTDDAVSTIDDLKSGIANNQDRSNNVVTSTGLKVGRMANVVTMTTCNAAADLTSNLMDGTPPQMPKCAGAIDDTLSSIDSKSAANQDDRAIGATSEEKPKVKKTELAAAPKWSDTTVFNIGASGWVGAADQFNQTVREGVAQTFGSAFACGGSPTMNINHQQEDIKSTDDQTIYTAVTATGLNPYSNSDKVKMKKMGDIEVSSALEGMNVILPPQNDKAVVAETVHQQQGKQHQRIKTKKMVELTNSLRHAWQMSSGSRRNQRLIEI